MKKRSRSVILLTLALVLIISATAVGFYYGSGIPQERRSLRLNRRTGRPLEDVPGTYPGIQLLINGTESSATISARPKSWRGEKSRSGFGSTGLKYSSFSNRPAVKSGDTMTLVFGNYPPDSVSVWISCEALTDSSYSSDFNTSYREIPCEYDLTSMTVTFTVDPEYDNGFVRITCVWDVQADREDEVLYHFAFER